MNLSATLEIYGGGPGSGPTAPCPQCGPHGGGELWKKSRSEYEAAPKEFKENVNEAEFYKARERGHEWEREALHALSEGRAKPSEVNGYLIEVSGPEAFKLLPQTLYHVTTNAPAVLKDGLKSRDELGQGWGHGLGGGSSKSISFTTDLKTARGIYRGIMEAHAVASGKLTVEKMIELAKSGQAAKKPWVGVLEKYYGSIHGPLDDLLRGVKKQSELMGQPPKEPGDWRPTKDSYSWLDGDGKRRYTTWERPMTPDEKQDADFDFYKVWTAAREYDAGGPLDPLFFTADVKALGKMNPKDVAILQFKPVPGAMGTKESALGEWRTYSGKAVKLEKRVHV